MSSPRIENQVPEELQAKNEQTETGGFTMSNTLNGQNAGISEAQAPSSGRIDAQLKLTPTIDAKFDELGFTDAHKFGVGIHILTAFSAAIGHRPHVVYGQKVHGNIGVILSGQTGIGKGASYRYAQEFFNVLDEPKIAPTWDGSNISSMRELVRGNHAILSQKEREERGELRTYHVNEEFGGTLRAAASLYHSKLSGAICKFLDGSPISEILGKQRVDYPFVHYSPICHITHEEFAGSVRKHLITSGLLNRFLMAFMPPNMTHPMPALNDSVRNAVGCEIGESLNFAATQSVITLDADANNMMKDFSEKITEERKKDRGIYADLTVRYPVNALKVAVNFSLLRRRTPINAEIMADAIALVRRGKDVIDFLEFAAKQTNPEAAVLSLLRQNGPMLQRDICKKLIDRFKIHVTRKAIAELQNAGMVNIKRVEQADGNWPYCVDPA